MAATSQDRRKDADRISLVKAWLLKDAKGMGAFGGGRGLQVGVGGLAVGDAALRIEDGVVEKGQGCQFWSQPLWRSDTLR